MTRKNARALRRIIVPDIAYKMQLPSTIFKKIVLLVFMCLTLSIISNINCKLHNKFLLIAMSLTLSINFSNLHCSLASFLVSIRSMSHLKL
jgi:hypothetical protein